MEADGVDDEVLQAAIALSLQTHAQDQTTDRALELLDQHSNRSQRDTAVATLAAYLNNVVQHPADPKYRAIRKSNKAFTDRVAAVAPAVELLKGWGWVEGPEFWTLPDTLDAQKSAALLAALTKKFHVQPPGQQPAGPKVNPEQQKQMDAIKRAQEERARIRQMMAADRQEVAKTPSRPSHAVQLRGGGNMGRASPAGQGTASGEVMHITSEGEYQRLISSSSLVVVDFYATWCGPCKLIAPHIEQMARTYPQVIFAKVDVDELQSVAAAAGVTAMPTFQFYRNGQKLREMKGANANGLEQLVHELSGVPVGPAD